MTPRTLKMLLAVSVAVNVFALAAGAAAVATYPRLEARVEAQHRPGRDRSVRDVVASLDPEVRERVREDLRASALAARSDFDLARSARREAIEKSEAETLNAAEVTALLERSRIAEMRGRARLEAEAVSLLASLGPDDRRRLAVILNRKSGGHGRASDRREPVAPLPPAPPRPPAPPVS